MARLNAHQPTPSGKEKKKEIGKVLRKQAGCERSALTKTTGRERGRKKKEKETWWPTLPKEMLHLGARVAQCDTKT